MLRRLIRWGMAVGLVGGVLLVTSGRWNDPWLWAYIAVFASVFLYALLSIDEDLARERFRPPNQGADRLSLGVVRLFGAAHLVVGALDTGRFHLTSVPTPLRVLGLVGLTLSCVIFFYAMLSNHFFSSVVRIQEERGHRVVDTGPYAIIRHPGYAGLIPLAPFSGLALGSWLSVAVALVFSALVLRRVLFEDAFLRRNLDGYNAYVQRVRYRLVPGVF